MKVGFYAGSFDPFTNGHLAIAKKAAKCFDKVIIGIGYNAGKFFRTVKEPINIHEKYHIGTIIESVVLIIVNYLLMAIIYSEIWECIVMAVFMIVIKGLTNLLEFIRKPPYRVIGLCILGIMIYIHNPNFHDNILLSNIYSRCFLIFLLQG